MQCVNDVTNFRSSVTYASLIIQSFAELLDFLFENNKLMKKINRISIMLFCLLAMSLKPSLIHAQVTVGIGVRVQVAPPQLPVYAQPPCPIDGYLWTPGYWAYNGDGYYWVPGVWVNPPQYGYLWTPCYWGFTGGYYGFHSGYWGTHIGYYGGVNYGYGYGGSGYYGGRWEGGHFRYNTAVVNVNTTIVHNTYVDRKVIVNNTTVNRTSFNGPGGISSRPTSQEESAMRETHLQPTSEQTSHQKMASKNRSQFASVNKGRPTTVAMNKVQGQVVNKDRNSSSSVNNVTPTKVSMNKVQSRGVYPQGQNQKARITKRPKQTVKSKPQQQAPRKEEGNHEKHI